MVSPPVFGNNGPISVAPLNTVWFREAQFEYYRKQSIRLNGELAENPYEHSTHHRKTTATPQDLQGH